jgi:hypothetical protein
MNPVIASYQGVTAFADLRYVFRDRIELTIDANRDVDYSYDPNGPYFLENGGRFTLTQRIVGPFGLIAIGERRDIQHQRLGAPSFSGRREITRGAGGGLAIQKSKQLRFELVYERMSRSSSEPGWRDYERQRIFASAIYGQ